MPLLSGAASGRRSPPQESLPERLPEDGLLFARVRLPGVAEVDLVVPPHGLPALRADEVVEPLDRRPLLRVRPDMHDLRGPPLVEPLDAELGERLRVPLLLELRAVHLQLARSSRSNAPPSVPHSASSGITGYSAMPCFLSENLSVYAMP